MNMKKSRVATNLLLTVVLIGGLGVLPGLPASVSAQSMSDYTAYPIFLGQTVPPNILFVVDFSEAMLPAAYGSYPLSYPDPAHGSIGATYASNYQGTGLTVTTTPFGSSTPMALADNFNSTVTYFGLFDSLGCYTYSTGQFGSRTAKTLVTDACSSSQWDGNFLNWLGMRKIDQAKQVLIGGRTLSASNINGTANTILGEPKTGQGGSTNTCISTSKSCYRYVKFVPNLALTGRVPTSLASDTAWSSSGSEAPGTISTNGVNVTGAGTFFTKQFQVGDSLIAGGLTTTVASITNDTTLTVSTGWSSNLAAGTAYYAPGRYFGQGEATIYVNSGATVAPFGASPSNQFAIQVDLTSETTAYQQQQSTGLLQNLRANNMRVGVMFTNSNNGVAATVFRYFDGNFTSSAITGIRNQPLSSYAALAESTYEALCYYRDSQGACFSNSPADFTASVGAQGDPYFFVSNNQMVWCCKSYILMISSGVPSNDQNNTPSPAPYGNLLTAGSDTIGLPTTRLDDVAFYGQTHDVRNDGTNSPPNPTDPPVQAFPAGLKGRQNVTFYSVNAMGGAAGSQVLASAALYGGFRDRDGNNAVELTGQTCTYPAGSSLGTGSSTSNAEWDADQDCVPDTYFEASDGAGLKAQIRAALDDILKHAESGTSISVLATSSTGEGSLYQAFFFPNTPKSTTDETEIKWTGYVQGLFVDPFGNIREDSDGDGRLIYQNDKIIMTRVDTNSGNTVVDRFVDSDGDGKADSTTPTDVGIDLRSINNIWEAGTQLALRNTSTNPRNILTWVDLNNNGVVDSGEQMAFSTANDTTLAPYIRAGAAPYTADNIINFIRGEQVTGLRDRQLMVAGSLRVWRLGDPAHSTPTVVGRPKERFDVLYGDASYTAFFQQYINRRQVAYVGANDGMLHAFNTGYYHRGDDPNTTNVVEHGWFTRTPTDNSGGPLLGEELWGFIPYQLLPQLQWLTQTGYTHVYYVDLKPKVTDARIFNADPDHPNGWGTILIGGFGMGGSCGQCQSFSVSGGQGAPPMTVNIGGTTQTFYSAYFVLDITNPEVNPKLLWVFTSSSLGLTTSYPTVLRMNPTTDGKTSNANAKWYAVFGSGPTGYDGSSVQGSILYGVDLVAGPGSGNTLVTPLSAGCQPPAAGCTFTSFMADVITLDKDLDYRADVVYAGRTINDGTTVWRGKMERLTLGSSSMWSPFPCSSAPCSPAMWGIASTFSGFTRMPTELIDTFTLSGITTKTGPVTASPTVTLDDSGQVWVFFGTGRFIGAADKTDTATQYLMGIKDSVMVGNCNQTSRISCWDNNLLNVSSAQICVVGTGTCGGTTNQVTGVTGVTTFDSLITQIRGNPTMGIPAMDGWVTTLPTAGERSVVNPTLIGGIVFYPTFIPGGSDICVGIGSGNLYALFYLTGSAYKESVIGTAASGSNTNVLQSMSLGQGLASQMTIQIGAQGSGSAGAGLSGSGCSGSVMGFIQSSSGTIGQPCTKPAYSTWSRYISWINQRD